MARNNEISEMPVNWTTCALEEIVFSRKGKKPKQVLKESFDDSIPYLDIKAIEKGTVENYADKDSSVLTDETELVVVWDGARSGWVGKSREGGECSIKCVRVKKSLLSD